MVACASLLMPVLASCAGGEAAAPVSGCVSAASVRAAVATDARPAVAIAAHDDRFTPGCIEAAAGELVLVVRNEGRHPHNLTVPGGKSVSVDGGQTGIIAVSVSREGLRYVCTIHPGMEARIAVVA